MSAQKWYILFLFSVFGILRVFGNSYMDFIKTKAEAIIDKAGGNTECARDLRIAVTDFIFRKQWALQMLDATAKIQPGLLTGNLYHIGSYDECLNIREEKDDFVIQGQYCTLLVLPSANFTSEFTFLLDSRTLTDYNGIKKSFHLQDILSVVKLSYGVCIPLSCSISNLQAIWDYIEYSFGLAAHAVFLDVACSHKGKLTDPLDIDYYIFAFFGIIFLMVILSTFYDIYVYQNETEENDNILVCFSAYTNSKKLISVSKPDQIQEEGYLGCLSGLKVISMFWIILGHRLVGNVFSGNINGMYMFEWRLHWYNMFLLGSSFSVDTFFIISGLLLSYTYLSTVISKKQKVRLVPFYLFRFIRLAPPLLAVILFYIGVLKYANDGPAWPIIMRKLTMACTKTWWATLFFLTNFIDINYQCIEQSWYLAVDSQLYFVSPLILFNMIKFPKKTFCFAMIVALVSILYTFIITVQNSYGAIYFEGNKQYHTYIYQPSFIRMPTWLEGVILGYFIFYYSWVKIPKVLNLFLWIISLAVMLFLILIHLHFTTNDYDAVRAAIFNSCARPLWGLALSFIIFSCAIGQGGFINQFLSLPIFTVLARLTYSFFLTHMGVLFYLLGGKRTVDSFSNLRCFHDFWGDLVFTGVVSVILCLCFEMPVIALGKTLLKKRFKTEEGSEKKRKTKLVVCLVKEGNIDKDTVKKTIRKKLQEMKQS